MTVTQNFPQVVPFKVIICPLVMCFVHTFSSFFFSFEESFVNFLNLKGINCAPKLCKNKYRSLYSFKSYCKDHYTSLPSPWIEKQSYVLRMQVCFFPGLCDFYAQYRHDEQCKTEESP